jgi:hypothetical protein
MFSVHFSLGLMVGLTAALLAPSARGEWLAGQEIPGVNGNVNAVTVYDDGTGPALYAGGVFFTAGGVFASNIAKWNGTQWAPLGSGVGGPYDNLVRGLTIFNGELIAGGNFMSAGGVSANNVARWNGTNWAALGSGMNAGLDALAVYNGELIAGGGFFTAGDYVSAFWARWTDRGDLNCDWLVNFDDINPFVLALSDPLGYQATYPHCRILNTDCNGDGFINFDDINAFVSLLNGK